MRLTDIDAKLAEPRSGASIGLNIISACALLAASAWFVNNVLSSRDAELAPRIVNSVVLEPTIVLAGKPFKAHINVTLNKLCPYEVHWSLVRPDGVEVVKVIEPVKPAPAGTGTQDLPVSDRYVPNSISPGDYKYVSEVYDQCPDGHTYTSARQAVALTVR